MRYSNILVAVAAAASAQTLEDLQNIDPQDLASYAENVDPAQLASYSEALASITADPAYSSLVQSIATANPTSLYEEANSYANSALNELSAQAATATGSEAALLSGLYTSIQAGLSTANAYATSALNYTGGAQPTGTSGGSGSASSPEDDGVSVSGSGSAGAPQQTGNGAAATVAPIALGAIGMAVLGML